MIKNSQPFGKNFQKTLGGGFFLTHTVHPFQYEAAVDDRHDKSLVICVYTTETQNICT